MKIVTMTLTGNTADVMEIVGLAVAANVLSGLQVREPEPIVSIDDLVYTKGPAPIDHDGNRLYVGDRVTQVGASSYLGLAKKTKGQHGKIVKVIRAGKGWSLGIEWDDGTEGDAYGRLLHKHGGRR